ncbi:MAG: hypothetical protein WD029_10175, partial [Microthrixaceae bacterium]
APYYNPACPYCEPSTVTINPQFPTAGGRVILTVTGFGPSTTVAFSVESTPQALGSAVANSSGTATLSTTLPSNLSAGAHTIRAIGTGPQGEPLNVTSSITVVAAGTALTVTATPTGLAATGSSSAGLLRIGVVVAVLGALLLLAGKRAGSTESAKLPVESV